MGIPVPLPGLHPGAWRGVPFYVPSASRVSGRRRAEFELAASDITLGEDLGLLSGPIEIEGVYVGDDYIAVEAALRAACETPGPGTLEHPWYGPLFVELAAQIETRFDAMALRSFTFRATFKLFQAGTGSLISTLSALLTAAAGLTSAAGVMTSAAMVLPFAQGAFRALAGSLATTLTTGPGGAVLASLGTLPAIGDAVVAPDVAANWQATWFAAIAAAGVPAPTSAIGPGPLGRDETSVLPARDTVSALLGLAASQSPAPTARPSEIRLSLANRAQALAAAITPLAAISYESRQEAARWSGLMADAFDGAMQATALQASTIPAEAGSLWRALSETKRRTIEDIDERIGRLPSVITITPPAPVSAWIVAQHVAGDTPARLPALMEDIARRNRLRHPAIAGPGQIETLP